jgi:hypothetical protein
MFQKFNWQKQGNIFNPLKYPKWGKLFGQVPYYVELNGLEKIFFTSRPPIQDGQGYISHVHAVDISTQNGLKIQHLYEEPILELGRLGTFDEFGTMPCSVIYIPNTEEVWMYYVGWNRKTSVPYDCAIGLAVSKDNGKTFSKYSNGPIIGANNFDPFLLGCPRVYRCNDLWYMFYLSGIEWIDLNGRKEAYYKLKVAKSLDGIQWERNNRFIIPEVYDKESQTCASVFYYQGQYHMYFTYRYTVDFRNSERGYRIGYASSNDLINWERNDAIGNFDVSSAGWDSEMVCYPNVNLIDGKLCMFYCGNGFGREGFGWAILQES